VSKENWRGEGVESGMGNGVIHGVTDIGEVNKEAF